MDESNSKRKLLLKVILVVTIMVVGGYLLFPRITSHLPFLKNFGYSSSAKPLTNNASRIKFTNSLERNLKQTLSPQTDNSALTYFNLALQEKSSQTKYSYILKTYQLVTQQSSNSGEVKYSLLKDQLQQYLKAFPEYKEKDL